MSSSNAPFPASDDLIQQHPPERGERQKKYVVLYSCCCCCCCCLHTLGGAIGAVVVGNYRAEPDEWDETADRSKSLPSSQWMFWSSFLVAIVAGLVVCGLMNPAQMSDAVVIMGWLVMLLGPLWMLAACGLSALQIALRSDLPNKSGYWRQLGKITSGMFVGSLIGVLVMVLIGVVLTSLSR
ncbi:MAG: hypothetical protein ACKV2Q_06660 [Planctomycetaceae bacterium]